MGQEHTTPGTLLIISQVYVPDPASVGQHMADAAAEMVRRGHRVVVLTSARGYDDPSQKYPPRETIDGVEIRRLPLSSFGKTSIAVRLIAGTIFMLQAVAIALFTRNVRSILVSTSPPMCAMGAIVVSLLRRAPITYWVMDLNPDQMIALGKITERSVWARVFDWMNRRILGRAREIVALDRFMADRLTAKLPVGDKITVLPPWPHEDKLDDSVPHAENPFRAEHGLEGKFVVMYSGNHGPSNPITTVLEAALRLRDVEDLVFLFVGGGIGKREVEETIQRHNPPNIRSLPYQPLSALRYSLSAADVHVVTVGDGVVGIVHPCKIYGAMAVARPIFFVGPRPSHVSDLLDKHGVGWHVEHGDADGAAETIRRIHATDRDELARMGARAQEAVRGSLSKPILRGNFCDVVERAACAAAPVGAAR